MANESTPTTADPESSASLNPSDSTDARLLEMKAAFERRPDRLEIERRIRMEQGTTAISPEDLQTSQEGGGPTQASEEDQRKLKEWRKEEGQPASANPAYDTAVEQFRESLGMDSGPEFEGHVQNIHSWVNETFGSVGEFDRLAAAAEEALGVQEAARLAIKLAGAHVAKKLR